MTPVHLAREVVSNLGAGDYKRILEPSCGDGAFLTAILEELSHDSNSDTCAAAVEITGIEIDPLLAEKSRAIVRSSALSKDHTRLDVRQADFFKEYLASSVLNESESHIEALQRESFDLIIGNPPFGGTFDHAIEDTLDARLGSRLGKKIKKETYAFFIVASLDLLRTGGRLVFICSDTILTIPTMTGLRQLLMQCGEVELHDIKSFSSETDYPMLLLDFKKTGQPGRVTRNSEVIDSDSIRSTPNLSWGITSELAGLFTGPLLGDYFVASSGMTTGKNELFVREIDDRNMIVEQSHFEFYDAPITLSYELERARLGRLSDKRRQALQQAEAQGETERRLRVITRACDEKIQMPDPRYRPYNKANNRILYSDPTHYIYWENEGDAVLTYKRTGNWYLRGVGGQPYFGREGITWPLVSTRFSVRYLPSGYILDSGAPCAFLRDGVNRDEIFFTIGWLLSDTANFVLKNVINHTRNIQSKDFERMPYPWWTPPEVKSSVIDKVKAMIVEAREGRIWSWNDREIRDLNSKFKLSDDRSTPLPDVGPSHPEQLRFFD